MKPTALLTACILATLAVPALAETQPRAGDAPLQLQWDARLRHEQVDDDGFAPQARADTLRLRLGLHARLGSGFAAYLEGAGVASADNHYDSGANGNSQYPAIADPRGTELNQAWLGWQGDAFGVTAGRQRIVLDNQRWVGDVGWRQHQQTYDGVSMQWQPAAAWTVRYAWLDRVHRVSGRDALNPLARERKLDTHLLNAAFVQGRQRFAGYAYLHEDRDVPAASTATYGVRWTGKPSGDGPGWTAETARQSDWTNNPRHFHHAYWLLEPSWTRAGITGRLGWEHMGGNGQHALQTPLATLHAFNGWADRFLVTPAAGLEDRYAALDGPLGPGYGAGPLRWTVAYHDFRADHGSSHYGSEWDAALAMPLARGLSSMLKLADYRADHYAVDDRRLWLQFEWHGSRALTAAP